MDTDASQAASTHPDLGAIRPREGSPRRLGVVLAAIGTGALAAGTIQYMRVLRILGRRPGFTFYLSCSVIAVGLLVFVGILLRVGPFS
jgi:uncharacterized membrane protein YidH (DUF202 family)